MKRIPQLLSFGIIFIFLFSACSIEKRRYMPGYNIEWKNSETGNKRNKFIPNNNSAGGDKIVSAGQEAADNNIVDETVTASSGHPNIRTDHIIQKSNYQVKILAEDCDVITLKSGVEIKAKVSGISPDEIKYKKCDDTNGITYTLKRSEILSIKYSDGTKDIFSPVNSSETKNESIEKEQKAEKEDTGIFGIVSFASMLAAIIIFIIYVGHQAALIITLSSLILVPLAIVCGAIGIRKKRKKRGLAIAGLALGIAAAFVGLLALILVSLLGGFNFGSCFSSGTKILKGDKTEINIESIKQGDCVIAYDLKSNTLIKTEVDRLVTARHSNLFRLTFDRGEITATDDHPFWVAGKGWASLNPRKSNNNYCQENSIDQLIVGDSLFLPAANKFTKLQNIQHIEKEQLTYTIELKEGNNFIANGLLVKTELVIGTEERQMLTSH